MSILADKLREAAQNAGNAGMHLNRALDKAERKKDERKQGNKIVHRNDGNVKQVEQVEKPKADYKIGFEPLRRNREGHMVYAKSGKLFMSTVSGMHKEVWDKLINALVHSKQETFTDHDGNVVTPKQFATLNGLRNVYELLIRERNMKKTQEKKAAEAKKAQAPAAKKQAEKPAPAAKKVAPKKSTGAHVASVKLVDTKPGDVDPKGARVTKVKIHAKPATKEAEKQTASQKHLNKAKAAIKTAEKELKQVKPNVPAKKTTRNDTEHLTKSPANKARLEKSVKDVKDGKVKQKPLQKPKTNHNKPPKPVVTTVENVEKILGAVPGVTVVAHPSKHEANTKAALDTVKETLAKPIHDQAVKAVPESAASGIMTLDESGFLQDGKPVYVASPVGREKPKETSDKVTDENPELPMVSQPLQTQPVQGDPVAAARRKLEMSFNGFVPVFITHTGVMMSRTEYAAFYGLSDYLQQLENATKAIRTAPFPIPK